MTNVPCLDANLLAQVTGGLFGYPSAPCNSQYQAMHGAIDKGVDEDVQGKSAGELAKMTAFRVFRPSAAHQDFQNRHPNAKAAENAWSQCELDQIKP